MPAATPDHHVLMQIAWGDHQVANITAFDVARTIGAKSVGGPATSNGSAAANRCSPAGCATTSPAKMPTTRSMELLLRTPPRRCGTSRRSPTIPSTAPRS